MFVFGIDENIHGIHSSTIPGIMFYPMIYALSSSWPLKRIQSTTKINGWTVDVQRFDNATRQCDKAKYLKVVSENWSEKLLSNWTINIHEQS